MCQWMLQIFGSEDGHEKRAPVVSRPGRPLLRTTTGGSTRGGKASNSHPVQNSGGMSPVGKPATPQPGSPHPGTPQQGAPKTGNVRICVQFVLFVLILIRL